MELREQIAAYKPQCAQEQADRGLMLVYLDRFDDVLTRENPLCHFTASAWIVNSARDRVLMAYHNIYDSWSWTGGHADGDGNLAAVALREAKEETGICGGELLLDRIYSLEILTVNGHVKRGTYVSSHLHLNCTYLIEADERERLRCKPDENSGVLWMPLADAVERCTEPCMRVIYEKLNDRLKTL